jgi:D-alanine-D-alanine ligase
LPSRIDIAFLGLHNKYGGNGGSQGLLELLKVPYTGAGLSASALGMDKLSCRRILATDTIVVPLDYAPEAHTEKRGPL